MKSTPSNLSNCKISWNNENVWIWNQICSIWVVLSWNLKTILSYLKSAPSNLPNYKMLPKNKDAIIWDQKTIVLFQISTLEFFKLQNFGKKQKYLVWVYLGLKFKKLFSYLKSDPWICLIAKFCIETKMPKFGTKNALFGHSWAWISKKLLSYLKSAPLKFALLQNFAKNKNAQIWDQKCLIWVFWGWNLKIMSYLK